MDTRSPDDWSLTRSLALLAAMFAIVLGTFLPAAVAASPVTGSPITLCAGEQAFVVHDADGTPRPGTPGTMDSLECADCVLQALTGLPSPPPVRTALPPSVAPATPAPVRCVLAVRQSRERLRPPPTAPPAA